MSGNAFSDKSQGKERGNHGRDEENIDHDAFDAAAPSRAFLAPLGYNLIVLCHGDMR